jgi:hypothetical protein
MGANIDEARSRQLAGFLRQEATFLRTRVYVGTCPGCEFLQFGPPNRGLERTEALPDSDVKLRAAQRTCRRPSITKLR